MPNPAGDQESEFLIESDKRQAEDFHPDRPVEEPLDFLSARFEAFRPLREGDEDRRWNLRQAQRRDRRPPALLPQQWRVVRAFKYAWSGAPSADPFVVPSGYPFDGASVPWPATALIPKAHSIYLGASALHDFLYSRRCAHVSRKTADHVFLEALLVSGLHWFWAGMMWRAVRSAGWVAWMRRDQSALGRLLRSGPFYLRIPVVLVGVACGTISGIAYDLVKGGRDVRRKAQDVRRADKP